MGFKRIIDSSYPNIYETWKTDDVTWVVQDLPPEDDEEAIKILVANMCPDEVLCNIQKLVEDPTSVHHIAETWRKYLAQRMSLGCYEVKNGRKTLVALNVCIAATAEDHQGLEAKGEKWKNVYDAWRYVETGVDPYKYMRLDIILHTLGLVVKREYRGAKLGKRLLAAREPLCKSQGIQGTATIFSCTAAQKLAESIGFETVFKVTVSGLAEAGMPYPKDDHRIITYTVKKFV